MGTEIGTEKPESAETILLLRSNQSAGWKGSSQSSLAPVDPLPLPLSLSISSSNMNLLTFLLCILLEVLAVTCK